MSDSSHQPDTPNDGSYVVVARRYRPRGFGELVGQEHVGRALTNAIETNRVGHAYLFTGARGVGKTSTARIFAKALNDPSGPTPTPDNSTDIAQAIDSGEDVDVIEIDGASNRGIDEIRSLRANVGVRPSRSRYKIYIIDEVHMLTPPAFNALLKTLEEPPEHVKFIFCTTDPEKIPITVLSRCQRFDFAPVEVAKIVLRLSEIVTAEGAQADDDALELIARRAAGSMRDSQSLLEQVLSFSDGNLTANQVHMMLGTADDERLHALATAMSQRDAADALRQLDAGIDAGVDAGRMAEQMLGYLRDLMAVAVGCDPSMQRHTSVALHAELKSLADHWGLQTVLAVVALVDQTLVRIRHSVHSRVLLEATLIQICNLPDLQHLADLSQAAVDGGTSSQSRPSEKKNSVKPPHFESKSPAADGKVGAGSQTGQTGQTATGQTATGQTATGQTAYPGPATSSGPTAPSEEAPAAASRATGPVTRQSAPAAIATTSPQPGSAATPNVTAPNVTAPNVTGANVTPRPTDTVAVNAPWDQRRAEDVWRRAVGGLESMTESFARAVERVSADGKNGLRLVFPAQSQLAKSRCELPEHKTALQQAVDQVAGMAIVMSFDLASPKVVAKKQETSAPRPSRMQRMREIEANGLIQSCVEVFGAEIVRIDKPK